MYFTLSKEAIDGLAIGILLGAEGFSAPLRKLSLSGFALSWRISIKLLATSEDQNKNNRLSPVIE
ncbi:MAG: hypothetical protein WAO12_09965 [Venatoribacter sp.]